MAKILVVEDETSLNQAYVMILQREGYEVASATNGSQALEVAEKENPDLILLDLHMPGMDGIGFLQNYQLQKNHPNVKVVVFSNLDMQKEIDEAYELGAERYVLKAMASPKELIKLVKDTLQ